MSKFEINQEVVFVKDPEHKPHPWPTLVGLHCTIMKILDDGLVYVTPGRGEIWQVHIDHLEPVTDLVELREIIRTLDERIEALEALRDA